MYYLKYINVASNTAFGALFVWLLLCTILFYKVWSKWFIHLSSQVFIIISSKLLYGQILKSVFLVSKNNLPLGGDVSVFYFSR